MELENKIEITTQFLDDSQIISKTGSWNWNVVTFLSMKSFGLKICFVF